MFILDTNVISELRQGKPQPSAAVRQWAAGQPSHQLHLPTVSCLFAENTTPLCAALHIPKPRSGRDAMIAATAIEHKFTVVTRNVSDFEATGVALLNPWL